MDELESSLSSCRTEKNQLSEQLSSASTSCEERKKQLAHLTSQLQQATVEGEKLKSESQAQLSQMAKERDEISLKVKTLDTTYTSEVRVLQETIARNTSTIEEKREELRTVKCVLATQAQTHKTAADSNEKKLERLIISCNEAKQSIFDKDAIIKENDKKLHELNAIYENEKSSMQATLNHKESTTKLNIESLKEKVGVGISVSTT